MIALLLTLLSVSPAHAGWSPIIVCDNYGMVVDRSGGDEYQLVIRNHPDTLGYFTSRANINRALNEKGEMIVSVSPGGPGLGDGESSSLYTGYISGITNVVISRVDSTSIKVGIWEVGYRSTHNEEVANWVFRGCSFR